ncbi:hypothetical protein Ddye_013262 [Dipteronia dyeriana]|uniref:Uncharacterized protein n=1 Tax=Dipteronia dyeriana TaxID=168575 RepID=A0AAD9X637_9ROSI|nr:hypothetical protein Ddye_013262 [Dipteronia dyeriana]
MENEPFLGSQTQSQQQQQHQLDLILSSHYNSLTPLHIFSHEIEHFDHHPPHQPLESSTSNTRNLPKQGSLHRCKMTPAMAVLHDLKQHKTTTQVPKPNSNSSSIIRKLDIIE